MATRQSLESKLEQLEKGRIEKASLLVSAEQQQVALNRERATQDQMLSRIKSSESKLLTELRIQEKAREDLSATIEQAITTEMTRVRQAQRQGRASTPKPSTPQPAKKHNNYDNYS